MDEFENVFIREIHISRYVASWTNCGYPINSLFKAWLKALGLSEQEIKQIWYFATNGQLELQDTAKHFMREKGLG
jgi:hypothetical protein